MTSTVFFSGTERTRLVGRRLFEIKAAAVIVSHCIDVDAFLRPSGLLWCNVFIVHLHALVSLYVYERFACHGGMSLWSLLPEDQQTIPCKRRRQDFPRSWRLVVRGGSVLTLVMLSSSFSFLSLCASSSV